MTRYWTVVKKDKNGKIIQRIASFTNQACANHVCDFKRKELTETDSTDSFEVVYSDVWSSAEDYLQAEEYPNLIASISSKLNEKEKFFLNSKGLT